MSYRDIKINLDYIMQFDPCQDGIDEYIDAGHEKFNGTIIEFLDLEGVSDSNKLWVVLREEIIPEKDLHDFACKFAESVLHLFEDKYPDDDRPRKAIQAKRDYIAGKISKDELRAARFAAEDAAGAAAWAAARAAAEDAAGAVARAAAGAVAGAAAGAAEKRKQLHIVKDYFKKCSKQGNK